MAGALNGELRALAATDPAMAALIERFGPRSIAERRRIHSDDPFAALFRIVLAQQVSTSAARTIWERTCDCYAGELPSPEETLELGAELRAAGMSGRKVEYVQGLAKATVAGELQAAELRELEDEALIERISALRGFGRWSAEMFLIFHLERPDVFSGGDLGLRRGIQVALELDESPAPETAIEIAERWSPHRSLASIYLWEAAVAPPLES
jgi:DNA-3-methyladenine glycosylase II